VLAGGVTAAQVDRSRQRHQASERTGQTRTTATTGIIALKSARATRGPMRRPVLHHISPGHRPCRSGPRGAVWGCSRGNVSGKLLARTWLPTKHDAARSAACPEISLWTLKTRIQGDCDCMIYRPARTDTEHASCRQSSLILPICRRVRRASGSRIVENCRGGHDLQLGLMSWGGPLNLPTRSHSWRDRILSPVRRQAGGVPVGVVNKPRR
jgi:hypothetical protein